MRTLHELQEDVKELVRFSETASRPNVRDFLSREIKTLQNEITTLEKLEVKKSTQPQGIKCYDAKIEKYAWDQSDKFVKLYIDLPGVHSIPAEDVVSTFTNNSMSLNCKKVANKNHILTLKNLSSPINTDKSYVKVKTDRLTVFMAKESSGTWSGLTTAAKKPKEEPEVPKVDKEEDPSAGIMSMMKKMYEDGDDDMKRTIAKAWTESRDKQMSGDTSGGMGGLGGMPGMGGMAGMPGMAGMGGMPGMAGMGGMGGMPDLAGMAGLGGMAGGLGGMGGGLGGMPDLGGL